MDKDQPESDKATPFHFRWNDQQRKQLESVADMRPLATLIHRAIEEYLDRLDTKEPGNK